MKLYLLTVKQFVNRSTMPLYSDLSYYSGAGSSSYSPYYSPSSSSSIGSYTSSPSYSRTYTPPPARTTFAALNRHYKPNLSTITESSYQASRRPISTLTTALTRVNSPKINLQSSYIPPRPIVINTADIDVSSARYHRVAPIVKSPERIVYGTGSSAQSSSKDNASESPYMPRVDQNDPPQIRSTIKRDRPIVRLSTIRSRSKSKSRHDSTKKTKTTDQCTIVVASDYTNKHSPSPEKSMQSGGQKSSWRDRFGDDLQKKTKDIVRKTPGELILEKHIIKPKYPEATKTEEILQVPDEILQNEVKLRKSIRRHSLVKCPSFKDICNDISSDIKRNDDLNAGDLRRRASQIFEEEDQIIAQIAERRKSATSEGIDIDIQEIIEEVQSEITVSGSGLIKSEPIDNIALVTTKSTPLISDGEKSPKWKCVVEKVEEDHTVNKVFKLPKKKNKTKENADAITSKVEKVAKPKPLQKLVKSESEEDFWGAIGSRETVYYDQRKKELIALQLKAIEESKREAAALEQQLAKERSIETTKPNEKEISDGKITETKKSPKAKKMAVKAVRSVIVSDEKADRKNSIANSMPKIASECAKLGTQTKVSHPNPVEKPKEISCEVRKEDDTTNKVKLSPKLSKDGDKMRTDTKKLQFPKCNVSQVGKIFPQKDESNAIASNKSISNLTSNSSILKQEAKLFDEIKEKEYKTPLSPIRKSENSFPIFGKQNNVTSTKNEIENTLISPAKINENIGDAKIGSKSNDQLLAKAKMPIITDKVQPTVHHHKINVLTTIKSQIATIVAPAPKTYATSCTVADDTTTNTTTIPHTIVTKANCDKSMQSFSTAASAADDLADSSSTNKNINKIKHVKISSKNDELTAKQQKPTTMQTSLKIPTGQAAKSPETTLLTQLKPTTITTTTDATITTTTHMKKNLSGATVVAVLPSKNAAISAATTITTNAQIDTAHIICDNVENINNLSSSDGANSALHVSGNKNDSTSGPVKDAFNKNSTAAESRSAVSTTPKKVTSSNAKSSGDGFLEHGKGLLSDSADKEKVAAAAKDIDHASTSSNRCAITPDKERSATVDKDGKAIKKFETNDASSSSQSAAVATSINCNSSKSKIETVANLNQHLSYHASIDKSIERDDTSSSIISGDESEICSVIISTDSSEYTNSDCGSDTDVPGDHSGNGNEMGLKRKHKKKKKPVKEFDPKKMVKLDHKRKCYVVDELPKYPLIATPRPLQKRWHYWSESETESDTNSDSDNSDSSYEECFSPTDNKDIIRMSTCSNDSGFEGGTAPASPKKMLGERNKQSIVYNLFINYFILYRHCSDLFLYFA